MQNKQLSEQEIALICDCLKKWEQIPVRFKEFLFEEPKKKWEYELTYWCKERENDIIANTWAIPLQKTKSYWKVKEWERENKLIFWDNLQVLKTLLVDKDLSKEIAENGGIKLIYIDPPFATKSDFKSGEWEKAYWDKIAWSEFIEFLRKRLILMRELLSEDWSIYVHLDWKKQHYIKIILDEIFWEENFHNDITWYYRRWTAPSKYFQRYHDTILFYSKKQKYIFNDIWEEASNVLKWRKENYKLDEDWRLYRWQSLHWQRYKIYRDERWVRIWDVWEIPFIHPSWWERIWYPTQKPERLLERVINASSNKWDIILDAFAWSGTTLATAEKLWRKWIGIDCWKLSIYTITNRLMNLNREIWNTWDHLEPKCFSVYNAWLYDFKLLTSLDREAYENFTLSLFQAKHEKHKIDGIELDWYIWADHVQVFDFNHGKEWIWLDYNYIKNLHEIIWSKIGKKFFIICPASKVNFIEDVVKYNNTQYYILRVPYSIISEIHKRPFEKMHQPISEDDVNNTVDSVWFDFIQIPTVELEYNKSDYSITIKTFKSKTISKKPIQMENLESLAMVIVDYEYNWEYINYEEVLYAKDLKKQDYKFKLDKNRLNEDCMIIYIDIFWNEKREIINKNSFN